MADQPTWPPSPYLIGQDPPSASEVLRSLASRYPNPTNAQAVAALEGLQQVVDADSAIAAGVREDIAQAYFHPDGILPRMRLLAWGWENPGDKFKSVDDKGWWSRRYQHPLWNPLMTYAEQMEKSWGMLSMHFDDDLAKGAPALLSYAFPSVVRDDLPPVDEAPCPMWLIPPGKFQMPIPNPECIKKRLKPILKPIEDVVIPKKKQSSYLWLVLVGIAWWTDRRERRK